MSPRTKKQNKKIREKKEIAILKSALLLFSQDGFNSTSMQSIASKASVSKGNLYNYFTSKEDLLDGVLRNGLNQFSKIYESEQMHISTKVDFDRMIRANFTMIKDNEIFWKLYYNLVAQPKVQDLFSMIFLPFFEEYMKVFESYFKNKGEKNPSATALLLGSSMDGISLGYIMMGENYPLDDIVESLIDKFK